MCRRVCTDLGRSEGSLSDRIIAAFFLSFFLSPPPLPKYKRTFNTRTNPAPLLLSGAGHVDVFNDVDGGGVDDYCSFVFGLLLFYFNSFSFFLYKGLVGPE